MKRTLTFLMVICALTLGAQVSTVIRIPSSPVAIMDPEVTDPSGFDNGLTIEEVGGVKYFRMPLNGWQGFSRFPVQQIPEEATHFRVSGRYDEGTSGVPAGNVVSYFQLWSYDWSLVYGMAEGESSLDFREYKVPLNLTGPAGVIQIAAQDRTNGYQAVTGAYIYFGKLEVYTEGTPEYHVAFEAAAGTRSVTISTEAAWSLTSDQPWLTLDKTSGSGSDVVNLTVAAQTAGEERTAVVTIHADGYDDQQLVVTQYGGITEFHAGDLAVLKTIRDNARTNITAPLVNIWNDLLSPADWAGVTWGAEVPRRVIALNVRSKGISWLDVSPLGQLEQLICSSNQITFLNVTGLEYLTWLDASSNGLPEINLTGLRSLRTLNVRLNQIQALDLNGLYGLKRLDIESNRLTNLDLTPVNTLDTLNVSSNEIQALNLGGLTGLDVLTLASNRLPFSKLPLPALVAGTYSYAPQKLVFDELTIDPGTEIDYTTQAMINGVATVFSWYKNNEQIPGETSSAFTPMEEGYYFCRMTNETFAGLTIETKPVRVGSPVTLDQADLAVLKAIRNAASTTVSNPLATIWADSRDPLTWSGVTWSEQLPRKVSRLSLANKGLKSLDVTALDQLVYLSCPGNQMTSLNVTNLANLTTLYAYSNQLGSISLEGLPSLTSLQIFSNRLTSLDLGGLPVLTTLSCYSNLLTALDLTGLSKLNNLSINYNQFTSLDLTGVPNLASLYCSGNQLTSLDLTPVPNLKTLNCSNNQITNFVGGENLLLTQAIVSGNRLTFSHLLPPSNVTTYTYADQNPVFEEQTVDPGTLLDYSSEAMINGVSTVYSWYKDNTLIPGEASGTYAPMEEGYYSCRMTNGGFPGLTLETKSVKVGNPADFDPEDLAALKAIRDAASTAVSEPLATIWADTTDPLTWPGVFWSEVKPHKVILLDVGYKGVTSLNVNALDRLQELMCDGNQITSLHLAHLSELEVVSAGDNPLASFTTEGLSALVDLYIFSTPLTSLDLTGLSGLDYVYLRDNQLASMDLTPASQLRYFYASNNQLATLTTPAGLALTAADLSGNILPFSQLIPINKVSGSYNFLNQRPVFEALTIEPGTPIDYSSEALVNGVATTFGWYVSGVQIPGEVSSTYTPAEEGYYFCRMTNTAFPMLTLETRAVQVGNPPTIDQEDLAALKAIRDAASTSVANPLATIWADGIDPLTWPGVTWTSQPTHRVISLDVSNKGIPTMDVTALDQLQQLYCYGNQMTSLQIAHLSNLTYLNAPYNQLESLSLEGLSKLSTLYLYNNKLTSLVLTGLSNLYRISGFNNQLTTLDLSGLSNLRYIDFDANQLVTIAGGSTLSLYGVSLSNNRLPFSQLFIPSQVRDYYYSGPQLPVFEERTVEPGTVIDFSSEALINGVATVFSWFKNNTLIEGATSSAFTLVDEGYYFCRMTNETFSGLTIDTKTIQVGNPPDFDAEDLAALKVIRDAASTTVTDPLATIWADSVDPLTWPGVTWSEQKPYKVIRLDVNYKGIPTMDVTALDLLQELYCSGNQMTSLQVVNLAHLIYLDAGFNQLESLSLSGLVSLSGLYVSDNKLTTLDLTGLANLYNVSFSNNQLVTIDLSPVPQLKYFQGYNNQLTSIAGRSGLSLYGVDLRENRLPFSQLFLPLQVSDWYSTTPQRPVFEDRTVDPGTVIDFSSEALINGVATVFSWYKNNTLIPDATSATYTPTEVGYYFCRMTNATFPGLTIETKVIQVGTPPDFDTEDLAALKAIRDAASTSVSNPLATIWADSVDPLTWPGVTWSEQKPYKVTRLDVSYKGILSMDVTAFDQLQELYCYRNQLTSLDLTGLTNLSNLNVSSNQLTSINLTGLSNLLQFDCRNNQLTSLDLTGFSKLRYFYVENNQLATLTGWSGLSFYGAYLRNNRLPFSQLILPTLVQYWYYFQPQLPVFEERTVDPGTVIDFSSEALINGVATVFTWFKNNDLIDGATSSTYIPTEEGYYFCRMTNETFPGLTIETRTIQVGTPPDFDSEDLAALKVIRDAASTEVPDPLATIWADSVDPLTWPGVTWSEQKPYKATVLDVSYKGILSMDVTALNQLRELNCYGNQMTSLQVANLANLTYLNASDNQLTSLSVEGLTALVYFYVSSNQLTSLELTGLSNLVSLDVSYNQLVSIDLTPVNYLSSFYCDNNQFTSIDLSPVPLLRYFYMRNNPLATIEGSSVLSSLYRVYLTGNRLPFSQLILPPRVSSTYSYLGQYPVFEERTVEPGTVVDFSSEALINGVATVFSWYKDNVLIEGATTSTYTPTDEGYYFCRMTNETFPGLTIETKLIKVGNPSDFDSEDLAALKVIRDAASTEVPDPLATTWADSVDPLTWPGVTWSAQKPYKVIKLEVNYKGVPSMDVTALDLLSELYCYGNQMTSLQVANLTNLTYIQAESNQLESLSLAGLTSLGGITVYNNKLTSLDVAGLSGLTSLNVINNQLTSLDLTGLSNLNVLDFGNNQLTSLDVTPTPLLNYFYGGYNQLSVITGVGGLEHLYGVSLSGNNLPFSQLVLPSKVSWEYYYGDQRPVFEERTVDPGTVIDFSSEATINGVATVFSWYKYNELIPGATSSTYTPTEEGYYFCRMTNETFPGLTIETKVIQVGTPPDFDPEDLAALKVIRDAASTEVPDPLATIWADSVDPLAWPGVTWSNSKPLRVIGLSIISKGILNLDVTALDQLSALSCQENQMTTLLVSNLANLTFLNASDNQLSSLSLTGLSKLESLFLANNRLLSLDLTPVRNLRSLFCFNNRLTTLSGWNDLVLANVFIQNNQLPFSHLILPSQVSPNYFYQPQLPVFEERTVDPGTTIDFSSEALINGVATVFRWYKDNVLIEGATSSTYTPAEEGFYFCRMTNETFPGLTIETKLIKVGNPSDFDPEDLAALKVIRDAASTTVPDPLATIWADSVDPLSWPGVTWSGLKPYKVTILDVSNKGIPSMDVTTLDLLTELTCYGNQMTILQVANLANLTYLNASDNQLTTLDLSGLSNLSGLYVPSNQLTSLDFTGLTNLQSLDCSSNQLTSLDLNPVPQMRYLYIYYNNITTITGGAVPDFYYVYLHYNRLPFSQLPLMNRVLNDYLFSPQNKVFEKTTVALGETIAYPSEQIINGITTIFTWYRDGVEIPEAGNSYSYTPDIDGFYHCTMTNESFPGLTLTTNAITVGEPFFGYDLNDLAVLLKIRDDMPNWSWMKEAWADEMKPGEWPNVTWTEITTGEPKRVTSLSLYWLNLATLDVLGLSELRFLNCYGNQLTSLDLTGLSKLEVLDCGVNALTSLGLGDLTNLVQLYCNNNRLTSLDISFNVNLQNVGCYNNMIPFSQMPESSGSLNVQGFPQNPVFMDYVYTEGNPIAYPSEVVVGGYQTIFTWYKNNEIVLGNDITGSYVPDGEGWYYCVMANDLFPQGTIRTYAVRVGNPVEYDPADVAILLAIRDAAPENSPLKQWWADISNIGNWPGISWDFAPKKVISLNLSEAGLTTLEVSGLTKLGNLSVYRNPMSTLSVHDLPELTFMTAENNQLTSLTLFNLPRLVTLFAQSNLLTSLDVSGLPDLYELHCNNNRLTSLILNGNLQNWGNLYFDNNYLPFSEMPLWQPDHWSFSYNPQGKIFEEKTIVVNTLIDYSSEALIDGEATVFRWYRDRVLIEESLKSALINTADQSGTYLPLVPGVYHCEMTNAKFPDLILVTNDVTVIEIPIMANADMAVSNNGYTGQSGVLNVLDNDLVNGTAIVPGTVTLTVTVPEPNGYLLLNGDGRVDIAAGTPAGTYSLTYQICETERPENCATASVTVQIDERPDVTLTLTVSPNIMTGTTQFNVLVKVSELNGVDTDGQITIYIPKEKRWSLQTFDPSLTDYLGTAVKNGEWTMSTGDSGYLFTTTASVPGGEFSAFTFTATWTGDNTRGKATLTTQILSGGNEVKVSNNSDSEVLNYFAQ